MNDAFYGREAWRGPGKRDRAGWREVGIRVKEARVFYLRRSLAGGSEADFQCLRFDDHARDMALDEVAVRGTRLSISGAGTRAMLPASALRFCRIACDTKPVTHTELVRVRRAHAVAAVVEEATGQKGGSAPELDLPGDGVGGALGLHGLEQIAGEDRLMLAAMHLTPIGDLAEVEPGEQLASWSALPITGERILCSASRMRLGRSNKTSLVVWCRRHIGRFRRSR